MAKTKKHAVAATTASARRSVTVNAKGDSRVGGPTDTDADKGGDGDGGTSNDRARRAARRGKATIGEKSAAARE